MSLIVFLKLSFVFSLLFHIIQKPKNLKLLVWISREIPDFTIAVSHSKQFISKWCFWQRLSELKKTTVLKGQIILALLHSSILIIHPSSTITLIFLLPTISSYHSHHSSLSSLLTHYSSIPHNLPTIHQPSFITYHPWLITPHFTYLQTCLITKGLLITRHSSLTSLLTHYSSLLSHYSSLFTSLASLFTHYSSLLTDHSLLDLCNQLCVCVCVTMLKKLYRSQFFIQEFVFLEIFSLGLWEKSLIIDI